MFDESSLTAAPPGRLLTPCANLRIVDAVEGREFVALDMKAGGRYTARLAEHPERRGSLRSPRRLAVYDEAGAFLAGATGDEHGDGADTLCTFVPRCSATHYIEARGCGYSLGIADPEPPGTPDPADARAHASDLGDIAGIRKSLFPIAHVRGNAEPLAFVRFSLTEPRLVSLGLKFGRGSAALFLENAGGKPLCGRTHGGSTGEWLSANLGPGAYYARVRMPADAGAPFVLRYSAEPVSGHIVRELDRRAGRPRNPAAQRRRTNGAHAPSGPVGGAAVRVSLGRVPIPERAGVAVRHRLVGGNESGLFELDSLTGEVFFNGSEADVAPGTTDFVLKVRSEDGDRNELCSLSVSVTRAPSPGGGLPGERARVSLGPAAPSGPQGEPFRYRLTGGNESGLFELDEATGELFYNGTAEELEEAENGFRLTVKVDAERH